MIVGDQPRPETTPMAEPSSSAVAGIFGWKLIGGAAGAAGLASLVVICMLPPRSFREWVVGMVTTVLGSVCGGAGVVSYFNLHRLADDYFGLVALIGVAFACGLPSWMLVRWTFTWMEQRKGANLAEIVAEVRRQIREV